MLRGGQAGRSLALTAQPRQQIRKVVDGLTNEDGRTAHLHLAIAVADPNRVRDSGLDRRCGPGGEDARSRRKAGSIVRGAIAAREAGSFGA
ncbi:MAG: hypothetical protein NVS3B18_02940 [Candidatus Dormibacteria bacterium]